jgi:hypothetical protein
MKASDNIETNSIRRDIIKVRVHDAIVGVLYLSSVGLAFQFGMEWLYVALGVALLQIISPFTKFCPVYAVLNKLMSNSTPMQNGK